VWICSAGLAPIAPNINVFSSFSSCLSFFLGPVEVANKFGMSTGAVHNCTRVFIGAVNKLVGTYNM